MARMKKNKWQKTIDDLLTVFRTGTELTEEINNALGSDTSITHATLSRIKAGKITKVSYEVGVAILITHVRFVNNRQHKGSENG